jgi:hypothetical protein
LWSYFFFELFFEPEDFFDEALVEPAVFFLLLEAFFVAIVENLLGSKNEPPPKPVRRILAPAANRCQ